MSFDQKPARVRVYSSRTQQGEAAPAAATAGNSGGQSADAGSETKRGGSVLFAVIFLGGCALGGAAYTALPHFGIL